MQDATVSYAGPSAVHSARSIAPHGQKLVPNPEVYQGG
jgi:hypothetical protein